MKAEVFNDTWWVNSADERYINERLGTYLAETGLTVLGELEHKFSPYGFTKLWLLAESHLAVHTFPEQNKTYIELSSCSEPKQEAFVKLMKELTAH